jgi:outer membrane immunogenic protein
MKKVFGFAAALAALGVVTSANAADLPLYTKAPALAQPLYDWSGFYIGAFGGGGYGNHNLNNALGPAGRANFTVNYSATGGLGGGEVGYNIQSGAYVFGVEADLAWAEIKGDDAFALGSNDATRLQYAGTLRGRSGFTIDRFLMFFTGGWAYGDLRHTNTDPVLGIDQFAAHRNGLTGGGGIAYALTDNLIGKVEYRYYDFGSYSRAGAPLTPNGQLPYSVNNTYSLVTVGLDFKFGGPVVARY